MLIIVTNEMIENLPKMYKNKWIKRCSLASSSRTTLALRENDTVRGGFIEFACFIILLFGILVLTFRLINTHYSVIVEILIK